MASSLIGKPFNAYRAVDGKLTSTPSTIPSLGPSDVLIRLTHSGVCYTDYEFFRTGLPLALGHEGVGIVEAVGSAVSTLKVGDRAGAGFGRRSCGHCRYCLTGKDIWCYERVTYGWGDFDNGTFSAYYVGDEAHLFKIPDGLASEDAAPLQCAGATVYTALRDTVKPTDRVGIIGIGGLGHLAIRFASKMGTEVVVFSTSRDKESEARGFGASEFVLLSELDKVSKPVDVLVVAGARYPDWSKVLVKEVLARAGIIIPLPAPTMGPLVLPADNLMWEGYNVHSSLVASRVPHTEMLEFAARHKIKPTIQLYKFEGAETIKTVFDNLENNKVRYRAVLEF
ncbi:chaperonin 10-like protein [Apodospora peruviana]|uniref:Chaperonin 10-like protein n=1 Tax=Apodospora peruviana TaxID=516989 RepID=A0AAE0HV02_9PEZI|nr:chaperonin 10-like protein [Apodospora peruviana]